MYSGTEKMLTLKGKGNCRGSAAGKTRYLAASVCDAPAPAGDGRREMRRLEDASARSRDELCEIYRELSGELGEGTAWLFLMQQLLLDDRLFTETPKFYIAEGKSASEAITLSVDNFFSELCRTKGHDYLSEISSDVRDVADRLIKNLAARETRPQPDDGKDYILLSKAPLPSEIYSRRSQLLGVVASESWETTSSAALVRALGIPAIFTDSELGEGISDKNAIIDASRGCLYINPDLDTVGDFSKRSNAQDVKKRGRKKTKFPVFAEPEDIFEALRLAEGTSEGVGILKSEELYLRSVAPPDEETLFEAYRSVAEAFLERPVTVRAFYTSGSVKISKLVAEKSEPEVELYVLHDETLSRQLRAVMRAAVYGNLSFALPAVSSYSSLIETVRLIGEIGDELRGEGREFSTVRLGVIIDGTAAALMCDELLKHCDFLIVKKDKLLSDGEESEIGRDARRLLLGSIAGSAKRAKKDAVLSLGRSDGEDDAAYAKKLGYTAVSLPSPF